jgi:hypothetical protein
LLASALTGIHAPTGRRGAASRDRKPRKPSHEPSVRRSGAARRPRGGSGDLRAVQAEGPATRGLAHAYLEIREFRAQRIELADIEVCPGQREPGILSPGTGGGFPRQQRNPRIGLEHRQLAAYP